MNKMQCTHAARRLACYLDTVGIRPAIKNMTNRERYRALFSTYSALPKELRREARRRGRRIIREVGLIQAALRAYPTWAIAPTIELTQQERSEQMAALIRESVGRCTRCSSWGQAKRSWPSRELAEAVRPFAGDMSLQSYECPVIRGSYHLGHRKEPASFSSPAAETTAV